MKKLVLIDSNALVHRAFHALPPLSSPSGKPTNAVYGFTSVLLKMIADLAPDYMVATFDLAGPTFRHEAYEEYKAHRVKAPDELYAQIPDVKRMLTAFGIPIMEREGFEADDIIGTVSLQAQALPDVQTVIVTGDLDTLQLVHGRKVTVFTLRKGMTDTVTYDEDAVRERFGIAPAQVPDLKGLKGDPSDNIPGVPGIGEKTATTLIGTYGSVERLYEELEKPEFVTGKHNGISEKLRDKLRDGKDSALFSKKLATIIRDVPVGFELGDADWHTHTDIPAIQALCQELGFYSLQKRITAALGPAIESAASPTLDLNGSASPDAEAATVVRTASDLPRGDIAVWATLEDDDLRTLHLTTDSDRVFVCEHPGPEFLAALCSRSGTLIGHDLKALIVRLPEPGAIDGTALVDTMIAAWLINPEQREYDLGRVLYDLGVPMAGEGGPAAVRAVWRLREPLWDRMKSLDLLTVYTDLEMPLIPILASMQRAGILIDTDHIDELLTMASEEVAKLESQIAKQAGGPFNINSPAQLGDVLFNRLGIRGKVRRTGTGAPSTAAAELEKLRDEHPIIELILQYRELNKLKTTYIEPFPTLIGSDRRIHTTYHQTGTATGRLSSSDPNLQNIPTRTELGQRFRSAFIAPTGFRLLSLDYSQLELRIIAHIARDRTMTEAFRNSEDIHTRTASEVFGVAPAQVDRDMRRQAKVLNFGIMYGMGVLGFARAAGVNRDTAKRFIDEYFARFPGIAAYMERTKEEAFERGYVSTLMGRRRPLTDIRSTIPQLAAQAERMAINHPIQGTGADIMKSAMIKVSDLLRSGPAYRDVRMLLQVHDELVLEVPEGLLPDLAHTIAEQMESAASLDVPLIVDAKAGVNWADMEPIAHTP